MSAFPDAKNIQNKLARTRDHLLDEMEHADAQAVQEAINLLEVVKRINTYTTDQYQPTPFPYEPLTTNP